MFRRRTLPAVVAVLALLVCAPEAWAATPQAPNTQPTDELAVDLDALRVAAEQGDAEAQYQLGDAYFLSKVEDVPLDDAKAEAYRWFRLAADQGMREPKLVLVFCTNSDGVSPRTMLNRFVGIAWPLTRDTPLPSSTSVCCTTRARACRRTMRKRLAGSAWPLIRDTPPRSSSSG